MLAKEREMTQKRASLIKDYRQDEFYRTNQLINKRIFEINNPLRKKLSFNLFTQLYC